jgi:hypothetical protein
MAKNHQKPPSKEPKIPTAPDGKRPPKPVKPITNRTLIEWALDAFGHLQKRTWATLSEAFVNPAGLITTVRQGERVRFENPVAFFLMAYYLLWGFVEGLLLISDVTTPGFLGDFRNRKHAALLIIVCVAVATHLMILRGKLRFVETIVAFCYVYGSAFIMALPVVFIGFVLMKMGMTKTQSYVVDLFVNLFIILQMLRAGRSIGLTPLQVVPPSLAGISIFALAVWLQGAVTVTAP